MKSLAKLNAAEIRKTDDGMFSVIDVIAVLTGKNAHYAAKILRRILQDSAVGTNLSPHKFSGKGQRETPVADRETILQIMQMLPGIAGDVIRKETATLVLRYIDADITLADDIIQRTEDPEALRWIATRAQGKAVRNSFTKTLAKHGVNRDGYRECTNAIYKPLFGGGAAVVRQKVGVPERANPREQMSSMQLSAVMLAENGAQMIIDTQNKQGNWQCENACLTSAAIIAKAVREISSVANAGLKR